MALFRTGLYVKDHSVEKVQVAKTPIASHNGNVTGLYIPELIAYITAKQSGSGTPTPDNIRPFIGVSECNVTRCGKNVWSYGNVSGTKRVAVTVDIKAGTYTVSANVTSSDTDYDYNLMLFYYEDNTTESVYINRGTRQNVTFTLTKNVKSINFYASRGSSTSDGDTFSFTDIQLEVGSSATAYEAYTGNIYTIQLGDTCYGGSLDVTTGVLTVDRQIVTLDGSETYSVASQAYIKSDACDAFSIDARIYPRSFYGNQPDDLFCDKLNFVKKAIWYTVGYSNCFAINNEQIHINVANDLLGITDYTQETTSTVKTKIVNWVTNNPITVKIPITPATVQLSPIQVEQLLLNNVWADTGNVAVKFYNVIR